MTKDTEIRNPKSEIRNADSGPVFSAGGMRSGSSVPEGHLTIARRFNAGEARKGAFVPKGRLRILPALSRPFGTDPLVRCMDRALKRPAILVSPYGAKRRRDRTGSFNSTLYSLTAQPVACEPLLKHSQQ
jgi:hypothetical protein